MDYKHEKYVPRLILRVIARMTIPKGGGIADGIRFIQDEEHRKKIVLEAERFAMAAIEAIKKAPDNTFGTDDEEIARALLGEADRVAAERMSKAAVSNLNEMILKGHGE